QPPSPRHYTGRRCRQADEGQRQPDAIAVFGLSLDSTRDFLSTRPEFRDEYPSEQADQDAETSLRWVL
ncbi:hypothetical protein, partial [Mesorhizobium sp. dw_380]|uniref:hypothetical protein n=1 Tax=Mesorhizobium sp. dw_380 TaxID=2812001 RepID=UPI001BDF71A0